MCEMVSQSHVMAAFSANQRVNLASSQAHLGKKFLYAISGVAFARSTEHIVRNMRLLHECLHHRHLNICITVAQVCTWIFTIAKSVLFTAREVPAYGAPCVFTLQDFVQWYVQDVPAQLGDPESERSQQCTKISRALGGCCTFVQ